MKDEHVRDEHVKDAAQDVAEDVTQDVAEDVLGAAEDGLSSELELELIQSHMAQKPVLRGEVGCACVAREVSVERGGMGERGCASGVKWGAPSH